MENTEILARQNAHLKLHFALIDKPVTCRTIRPFLPILAIEKYAICIPTPVTVHIEHCPQCERDMQTIQNMALQPVQLGELANKFTGDDYEISDLSEPIRNEVETIFHQDDSGIVTIFKTRERSEAEPKEVLEQSTYTDWPVDVEVITPSETEQNSSISITTTETFENIPLETKKPIWLFRKPYITAAGIAAAITITCVLLFYNPAVTAISLDHIHNALSEIDTLHMIKYVHDRKEPVQELWIARSQQTYLIKTGKRKDLWDISKENIITKQHSSSPPEIKSMGNIQAENAKEFLTGALGAIPFRSQSSMPRDAEWKKIIPEETNLTQKDIVVYELEWTSKASDGSIVYRKWRGYINLHTHLPQEIHWYIKINAEEKYALDSTTKLEIISLSEFTAATETFRE
jgi:hypothetical protein